MSIAEKRHAIRKDRLLHELAWLESRVLWWVDKEQEFRRQQPNAHSLIRTARQKRKTYQAELKQAKLDLAAL